MSTKLHEDGNIGVTRFGCPASSDKIAYQIDGPENPNCPCNIVYVCLTSAQALEVAEAIILDIAQRKGLLDAKAKRARKAVARG